MTTPAWVVGPLLDDLEWPPWSCSTPLMTLEGGGGVVQLAGDDMLARPPGGTARPLVSYASRRSKALARVAASSSVEGFWSSTSMRSGSPTPAVKMTNCCDSITLLARGLGFRV
jgi:hypothetical protein